MKTLVMSLLFVLTFFSCYSQDDKRQVDGVYFTKLSPIDNAIFNGDFVLFKLLFVQKYWSGTVPDTSVKSNKLTYLNHLYFYAGILSKETNKKDSAFNLFAQLIYDKDFDNYDGILGDVLFNSIRNDKRWKAIEEIAVKSLYTKARMYKNPSLRIRLMVIHMIDQSNMLFSRDTNTMKQVNKMLVDSIELILRDYGHPKVKDVGKDVASVPALVLIHADLTTQLKYKSLIYEEGLKGNIPGGNAGVLLDKIQVKQKGTQLYGSQYKVHDGQFYFYPIEDSLKLIDRRKKLGFTMSYEDYKSMILNQFNR